MGPASPMPVGNRPRTRLAGARSDRSGRWPSLVWTTSIPAARQARSARPVGAMADRSRPTSLPNAAPKPPGSRKSLHVDDHERCGGCVEGKVVRLGGNALHACFPGNKPTERAAFVVHYGRCRIRNQTSPRIGNASSKNRANACRIAQFGAPCPGAARSATESEAQDARERSHCNETLNSVTPCPERVAAPRAGPFMPMRSSQLRASGDCDRQNMTTFHG